MYLLVIDNGNTEETRVLMTARQTSVRKAKEIFETEGHFSVTLWDEHREKCLANFERD
jgi:hypothetical protein